VLGGGDWVLQDNLPRVRQNTQGVECVCLCFCEGDNRSYREARRGVPVLARQQCIGMISEWV